MASHHVSHQHTVLVVEDEPLIRFALSDALEDEGYRVLEASNVLEAIAILGKHSGITALITDIDMPGALNGLDLARLVESYDKRIATLVTSGGHAMADGDVPGEGRFFSKPYRLEEILRALATMIVVASVPRMATARK